MKMLSRSLFGLALLCVGMLSEAAFAQSFGHWHLPSTPAQFCGYGYGAGHHVPMIRPVDCEPLWVPRTIHVYGCQPGHAGAGYCDYRLPPANLAPQPQVQSFGRAQFPPHSDAQYAPRHEEIPRSPHLRRKPGFPQAR